ncbi:MAG: phytase, partial [bacterium]
MSRFSFLGFIVFLPGVASLNAQVPDTLQVAPTLSTAPAQSFAADPAIWVHPGDPSKSLILGTDKGTFPSGGVFVWNLDGTQQQRIIISHPNHIDVEYGMNVGGELVDIAVVTMRDHDELRVFKIDPQRRELDEITTAATIRTTASPFGLGVYKRPSDGEIFAIVSSRDPERINKVQQFRLHDDGLGKVAATEVGQITNTLGLVDGIVVDDQLGYLYLAEDSVGISKYFADPAKGEERLAFLATDDGINDNREGLAIYGCSDSTGYLLLASPEDRAIYVFPREGD